MHRLDGRVALVTGGARGIGAATAAALANAGAAVMITDRLAEPGEQSAAHLRNHGHAVHFHHHDVSDENAWTAAVAACEAAFDGLDILVNNAGVGFGKPLLETTLAEFRQVQAINSEGVFLGMRTAIPLIARRADRWPGGGSIINLSSIYGIVGAAGALAYNASKGAVRLMTKSAALECAQAGLRIRINSLHPGFIDTAMHDEAVRNATELGLMGGGDEVRSHIAALHPLGHIGTPANIADAILFLASDAAAYMTGSELVVDGGMTAQ